MKDTALRSFVKGISWRVFATIDTIMLSLLITGNITNACKIGLGEVISKTGLYFLHERLWNKLETESRLFSHGKSFLKGISWRIVGSIDTFIIALIFTGNPFAASQIAALEVITKIVLFYVHERGWEHISWGKLSRRSSKTTLEDYMTCQ